MASSAYAAATSFEVVVPKEAKVGEAVDVTVRALDDEGKVDPDYEGNIYFNVTGDPSATVPFFQDGYTFSKSDQGEKLFSKGLVFTKEGAMTVTVVDILDDALEGSAPVKVGAEASEGVDPTEAETTDLTVTSPTDGTVAAAEKIDVVGTTKKNSKILFFINGKQAGEAQSDDSGAFLGTMEDLSEGKNVLKIRVLNGKDQIIAESRDISFSVENAGPAIQGASIIGGNRVPAGRSFTLEVRSESGLTGGKASFSGASADLIETATGGTYAAKFTAPIELGDYPISVELKNALGAVTNEKNIETLSVTDAVSAFKEVKTTFEGDKTIFTFSLVADVENLAKFRFRYGAGTGELTESVLTLDRTQIKTSTGDTLEYAWYIKGLEPDTYRFQIMGVDTSEADMASVVSDEFTVEVVANAAGLCRVDNVTGLKATRQDDKVVLSWNAAPSATSGYNVYKKDAKGEYQLIENVTGTGYSVHFSSDRVEYTDFAVKGVCDKGAGLSPEYASVLKVQTGPALTAFLALIAFISGYFILRRFRLA
ncbi:MAG TPA: hypothetical protein PK765_06205 [bacterium]|nr:hypothetical protein [bacterium]